MFFWTRFTNKKKTGIPQGSIWGPVLLNVFINGLDDRNKVHSQQIHKLFQTGGSVNTLEARTAIQTDLVSKNGLTETSGSSTQANGKSCIWDGATPCISTV